MLTEPVDIVILAHDTSWDVVQACASAIQKATHLDHRLLLATSELPASNTDSQLRAAGVVEIVCDDGVRKRAALRNLATRSSTSEFFVLLDARTKPQDGWLEPLIATMRDPSVGLASSITVRPGSEEILQAGLYLNSNGEPLYYAREEFFRFLKPDEIPTRPPAVSGDCMLVRRSLIDAVSGFDERYEAQFDDFDFCLRAGAHGYDVALVPTSVVFYDEPGILPALRYQRDDLLQLNETIRSLERDNRSAFLPKRLEAGTDQANPLVSLLYPAYNDAAFLEQNIRSIINQTYDNWELIVVNDASSDDTLRILGEFQSAYPDRIRIFHKENHDRFEAWAICYAESRGDYLAILGADDVLLPWCVEEQVRALAENPSAAFVYGDVYRFDNDGKLIEHLLVDEPAAPLQVARLLAVNYLVTPSMLIRRTAVESAGGWLNRQFLYSQDYELWLRLLYGREQKHTGRTLIKYRVHDAQLTVVIGNERMFASGAAAIRDKFAKWRPEEVFRGLDLNSGGGQAAAYKAIYEILFSEQTGLCGVETDVLRFFKPLINRPSRDDSAREAKFTLLHSAASLFRSKGQYGLAAQQLWRAILEGAPFQRTFYKLFWRKSRSVGRYRLP
jgi:GT2 family glycosyltransferase